MQPVNQRPTLHSFRALAVHGENRGEATGTEMRLDLQQDIKIGLAVPSVLGGSIQVTVLIKLKANAVNEKDPNDEANFAADYEAKFYYPLDATEATVTPLMENNEYQYGLIAQAYPLAMTHFRRELQALGLDARALPLGLQ